MGRVELDKERSAFNMPSRKRELAAYTDCPESCAGQDEWMGGSWVREERTRLRLEEGLFLSGPQFAHLWNRVGLDMPCPPCTILPPQECPRQPVDSGKERGEVGGFLASQ